jgi:S-formylglutathione hydrolase FrmB
MRPTFFPVAALWLTLAALAPPAAARAQGKWHRASSEPIELASGSRVEFSSMPSEAIHGTERFSVFLPPSYAKSDARYPVVYFLHGLFNDETSWTMDNHGDIPARVDQLMSSGTVPEMVLVHPDGDRSFYMNSHDGSVRYEDLIVKELPAYIESHYRVKTSPAGRAIAGTSMGGYGALKIAMRHPELYAAVAAHSPIVFPVPNPLDVPAAARESRQYQYLSEIFRVVYGDPFDQAYFDANNPLVLAGKGGLDGLAIYFDYGTADRYNERIGLGMGLTMLDRRLTEADVAHTFHAFDGEPHGWELVYTHIEESLGFLGRKLTAGP